MFEKIREAAIAQKLSAALLLAGFGLLLIEVRFEHQSVLTSKWQSWIPIVYSASMRMIGPVGLLLWNRGGQLLLTCAFALAPIIGSFGFWFHSKADPVVALKKVIAVISMTPGKIPMDADGPPVLAPLALVGLGMLGVVVCAARCAIKQKEETAQQDSELGSDD